MVAATFQHSDIEYECLLRRYLVLGHVLISSALFRSILIVEAAGRPLRAPGSIYIGGWVVEWGGRCESTTQATSYLFVCSLMENKPGEMKCFAWKIDFFPAREQAFSASAAI